MTLYESCSRNEQWAELSPQEIDEAIRHGVAMRKLSLSRKHKNHKGYDPDDRKAMRVQALGALAEAVACRVLRQEIRLESEVYNVADLPNGVQVRLIGRDNYGLRVYPKDDPSWSVLGVVILEGHERVGRYRVPGWYRTSDALERDDWKMAPNGRPPMWCVPQSELMPARLLIPVL